MRKLFRGITELIKNNGFAMIAIVAFISFFIVGSVVRCTSVHNMSDKMPSLEVSPEEKAEEELGRMASLRNSYTEKTNKLIDLLRANLWVAESNEGIYMRFTDKVLTESSGTKDDKNGNSNDVIMGYVIEVVKESKTRLDDGTNADVTTFVIRTADWVDIATITTMNNKEGKPYEVKLECPSLSMSKSYLLATEAHDLKIDGPSSAWMEAHNVTTEQLEKELKKWCALNYPTVTEATWDSQSVENYEDGSATIKFSFNTKEKKGCTVTISSKNKTITITK